MLQDCSFHDSANLYFVCYLFMHSYNHDNSETVEDNIEFSATDGTNSVRFVLQVKVSALIWVVPYEESNPYEFKFSPWTLFSFIKVTSMWSSGEAH